MTPKQRARFFEDLSTMTRSGISLERGLDVMKKGKAARLLILMDTLQHHVGRGASLWEGLSQFPEDFDQFQIMLIKAAEESGKLVETCKRLARHIMLRYKEKRKLQASLIYPVILMHAVVMLPPLKYLFLDSLGKSYWSVVMPVLLTGYAVIGAAVIFWKRYGKNGPMREKVEEFIYGLPVLGNLTRSISMTNVFRALSDLYNAGVPPLLAMKQAITVANNNAVSQRLTGAMEVLEHGGTFTDYFSFTGVLPQSQLSMVEVGEESGQFSESLNLLVARMEEVNTQQLETSVKALVAIAYTVSVAIAAYTIISFYAGHFSII